MNIQLQHGVSDITSVTGLAIITAILAGERDPVTRAGLRDRHCQHSEAEIARALQGTGRAEPLFAWHQAVELYEFYHGPIAECDQQIAAHLQTLPDQSGGKPIPAAPRKPRTGYQRHLLHPDPLRRFTAIISVQSPQGNRTYSGLP